jgi:hypothetical protein
MPPTPTPPTANTGQTDSGKRVNGEGGIRTLVGPKDPNRFSRPGCGDLKGGDLQEVPVYRVAVGKRVGK